MRGEEKLSLLIESIYETLIDPAHWRQALQEIGVFADAARMTLIMEDASQPSQSAFYSSYDDPDWTLLYIRKYMMTNPLRLAAEAFVRPGDILLTTDFFSPANYRKTAISQEFLSLRGIVDIASAILEKTGATITVLSFKRSASQGFADEDLRRRAHLVMPHVRRATALSRVFEQKAMRLDQLAASFDKLEAAIFLLDARGHILDRNLSARELLQEGQLVMDASGRILVLDIEARAEFEQALDRIARGQAMDSPGAAMSIRGGDKLYVGSLAALTGPLRPVLRPGAAQAMFCLRRVKFAVPHQAAVVAQNFGLSRRETSVLFAIVELDGVKSVAADLGLTEATVRSYLKSIFQKTQTSRQADLVKLVASSALPLR